MSDQQTPSVPVDQQTFAIGVLSITAIILFVAFLLVPTSPKPAYAIGTSDAGGDYKMVTMQLTDSREGCVVIDAATRRLHLYAYNFNGRIGQRLQLISRFPLERLPGAQIPGRRGADDDAGAGQP